MEALKIQVRKEIYDSLVSMETNKLNIPLTNQLSKRISKNKNELKELLADNSLLKDFDQLCVSCIFSSDKAQFPIKKIKISRENLEIFIEKNPDMNKVVENKTEENIAKIEDNEKNNDVVSKSDEEKPAEKTMGEKIDEILDEFCKNKNVTVVFTPRVNVQPNGVLFGLKKTLPIKNDAAFHIDIEKQNIFFTYDMSEDEFIEQLEGFLKKMLTLKFIFIWRKKCIYKELENGKRVLTLYYTTRKQFDSPKKFF